MSSTQQLPARNTVLDGLSLVADGSTVIVNPGTCDIDGQRVTLTTPVTLSIAPAESVEVRDELIKLSPEQPESYLKGTRLRGPDAKDVNALHSLNADSVRIRRVIDGDLLREGTDYLVSPGHAMLGLGPQSAVTENDTVFASYRYALMRIDAVEIDASGQVILVRGTSHITVPLPPTSVPGRLRLAHIFRPYRSTTVSQDDIYPISESAAKAQTGTTPGRIPRTLAKLLAGEAVTIVCWGDSVTAGGNASAPEYRYVDVFAAGLRERFPQASINVVNVSVGGSSSVQWLYPEEHPARPDQPGIDFQRVLDAAPDLVTIEFVNDGWMTSEDVERIYSDIVARFTAINAEIIFITPHFTHPDWMEFTSMRQEENRTYVLALKDFTEARQIALADASARWGHLWKEGIPYLTLLHNTLNHPDDRGHQLFADELWACFA